MLRSALDPARRAARPLNSRLPWPLYATDEQDEETSVFTGDGTFTDEFALLIAAPDGESKTARLDEATPGWREMTRPNGARMFSSDGTMLDDKGNRSIFDDIDE